MVRLKGSGLSFLLLSLFFSACEDRGVERKSAVLQPTQSSHPGGQEHPDPMLIGFTPYLPKEQLQQEFKPLVEHVAAEVGVGIEMRFFSSYSGLARAIASGDIHLAVLSPFAYVDAKEKNPDLVLLVAQIADGSSTYSAYIVTRADSGFRTIQDLKGQSFGFVDKKSTSGYLYPMAYLHNLGIEPRSFFGSIEYTGNHTTLVRKVLNKKIAAGATYSAPFRLAQDQGLKILAKTGRIPYDAYCASTGLAVALTQKVRKALLGLSTRTEAGRGILQGLTNINGFVAVEDEQYNEVRRVAKFIRSTVRPTP